MLTSRTQAAAQVVTTADNVRPLPSQMTSLMYHELTTPLASALWYLGIADGQCAGGPSGAAREAVAVARAEIQRLKELVDRVIELERHGRPRLQPRSTDLADVVRQAVRRSITLSGNESPVTVETDATLVGFWDDVAVQQIVTNLLSNAYKFGRGQPINVQVRAASGGARILVRDNGVGIRPGDRKRIFERHVCAPQSKGGGLGLGLWLVRELAAAHGGRVMLRSRMGQGATFHVYLQRLEADRTHRALALVASRTPQTWTPRPTRRAPSP
jgi:signal transduction histidine kinase